jgi:hypothetical protein
MPYPPEWPPSVSSSHHSLRVFIEGTATADFADSAYLFLEPSTQERAGDPPEPSAVFGRTPNIAPGEATKPADFGSVVQGGITTGVWEARNAPVRGRSFVGRPTLTTLPPPAAAHCTGLSVFNSAMAGVLEISFGGGAVHGRVQPGERRVYSDRHEGGIAVRGAGIAFEIEAW